MRLGADIAIVDKRRPKHGQSEVMNIIGDVSGRKCILIDDIVDSGGTLIGAADALLEQGAIEVSAYCSHGVLSNGAATRIAASKLKELVITNSIEQPQKVIDAKNIRQLSVGPLLAKAIRRISNEESVSVLFE
jgi:ribose-phosphate pyrophosphokinase